VLSVQTFVPSALKVHLEITSIRSRLDADTDSTRLPCGSKTAQSGFSGIMNLGPTLVRGSGLGLAIVVRTDRTGPTKPRFLRSVHC
jgi:hypothetical protein